MATNFTESQVDRMVGEYNAAVEIGMDYNGRKTVVDSLAKEFDVSDRAIIGKLVAEGVYIKKEVAKTSGSKRVDKAALVKAFEAAFGMKLKSMANMTGKDLEAFWDRFVEMSEIRNAEEGK